MPRYSGPFRVVQRVSDANYRIASPSSPPMIVNIERLKPAVQLDDWMQRVDLNDVLPPPPRRSSRPSIPPRRPSVAVDGYAFATNADLRQANVAAVSDTANSEILFFVLFCTVMFYLYRSFCVF